LKDVSEETTFSNFKIQQQLIDNLNKTPQRETESEVAEKLGPGKRGQKTWFALKK
jgi:hypothetical protein